MNLHLQHQAQLRLLQGHMNCALHRHSLGVFRFFREKSAGLLTPISKLNHARELVNNAMELEAQGVDCLLVPSGLTIVCVLQSGQSRAALTNFEEAAQLVPTDEVPSAIRSSY